MLALEYISRTVLNDLLRNRGLIVLSENQRMLTDAEHYALAFENLHSVLI
jgi:hypothetical protein